VLPAVDSQKLFRGSFRRIDVTKRVSQARIYELVFDCVKASRAFRVCRAGVMLLAYGVRYIGSSHDSHLGK